MGLNNKRGRIPNSIKEHAKREVDQHGYMAYHYACYNTGFGDCPDFCDKEKWYKQQDYDYKLIDCIVKEQKSRGLWI